MNASRFDQLARSLGITSASRRSLFAKMLSGVLGGEVALIAETAAAKDKGKHGHPRSPRADNDEDDEKKEKKPKRDKDKKPKNNERCQDAGRACVADDDCCGDLVCQGSGQSAATCQAPAPAIVTPSCRIDVQCAFDAAGYQTRCTCTALVADGEPAITVILPPSEICVEVVSGNYVFTTTETLPGEAGYASPAPGQPLTLVLAGMVQPEGSATYWCQTQSGLVPATGPRLMRVVDDLSDAAGAVVVHATICNVVSADVVTDWFRTCLTPDAGATFTLVPTGEASAGSARTGVTAADGKLRFGQLPPGAYQLTLVNGAWCHAESDGVDARGNVIVEAGRRTNVWIFRCGG
jgi:hypothetical protein